MDDRLAGLLTELHATGATHDAAEPDRLRRYRNLEPDTAELLTVVLRAAGARKVVEVGTSNGYSTLWLADAVRDTGGSVLSIDAAPAGDAAANLARAGLSGHVQLHRGDGGAILAELPDGGVDLLFLDAERTEYPSWWPHPLRVLRTGGLLAVDNVLSHPDEVAPFLALLADSGRFTGTTVAVGKGLYLGWLGPSA